MENLKIENLKENLIIGDFGEDINYYDHGYIGDIITEIADNHIDLYNSDLLEWACGNYSYIEDSIREFGINEKDFDFFRLIQQGQYYANEQNLYDNLQNIVLYRLYSYIVSNLGITKITEEQNNEILLLNIDDNNEKLENLLKQLDEIFKNEEEQIKMKQITKQEFLKLSNEEKCKILIDILNNNIEFLED